jgi:hypothetical protein
MLRPSVRQWSGPGQNWDYLNFCLSWVLQEKIHFGKCISAIASTSINSQGENLLPPFYTNQKKNEQKKEKEMDNQIYPPESQQ